MIYFFSDFPVMSHHTFETPNISPTYRCSPLDALAPPVAKNVSRRSWNEFGFIGSDFPESKKDQNEPRTPEILGAEILRAGINAVRNLSSERCKKNKIENYSDSAKKERMKNPKTPKMQVTKNNVLIRPQGKINNFCKKPHL